MQDFLRGASERIEDLKTLIKGQNSSDPVDQQAHFKVATSHTIVETPAAAQHTPFCALSFGIPPHAANRL